MAHSSDQIVPGYPTKDNYYKVFLDSFLNKHFTEHPLGQALCYVPGIRSPQTDLPAKVFISEYRRDLGLYNSTTGKMQQNP